MRKNRLGAQALLKTKELAATHPATAMRFNFPKVSFLSAGQEFIEANHNRPVTFVSHLRRLATQVF
jgi:hypothetical protein